MHNILHGIYLVVLLLSSLCGLRSFRMLDIAARILCILVCLTFLEEIICYYAAYKYRNNIPEYDVFSVVEFLLVSLYFNYSVDVFQRYKVGMGIGIAGCILGIADIAHQTINHLDSYFLFFDGITVITMALYSFARLVQKYDDIEFKHYPHFWLGVCLVFFWAITFLTWGLYDHLRDDVKGKWLIDCVGLLANIFSYIGIGIVFFLFPKMRPNDER